MSPKQMTLLARLRAAVDELVTGLPPDESLEALIDARVRIEHRVHQAGGPSHITYQSDRPPAPNAPPPPAPFEDLL